MDDIDTTIESVEDSGRDKRRVGFMLVAASSVVTLALIAAFAFQMIRSSDDMIAKDADKLGNFSTAAGSEK